MTINIPTIDELSQKVRGYFNANMTGVDAYLPQTFLYVTAKVFALIIYPLYYIMSYVSRQIFATTADTEYLNRHATELGLTRKASSKSSGKVQVISVAGEAVSQGDILSRSDGTQYIFTTSFVTTGDDTVTIEAVSEGSIANSVGDTELTLAVSNENITSITVTDDGLAGGSEEETDESLRGRILFRKRNFALTGTENYFSILLQNEISGVTRIFIDDPKDGSGSFTIYFMMDDTYSDGVPLSADVTNAQAAIDAGYFVGTSPIAAAPSLQEIPVEITVGETVSATQRDNIILEVQDVIREEGGLSTSNVTKTFFKEDIDAAVSRGLGNNNFTVTAPSTDVTIASGSIPTAGTINISVSVA